MSQRWRVYRCGRNGLVTHGGRAGAEPHGSAPADSHSRRLGKAVALDPGIERARKGLIDSAGGEERRGIVEMPAEAAVVEIDHPGLAPVNEHVVGHEVGVDQAEAAVSLAEAREALEDEEGKAENPYLLEARMTFEF